MFHFMIKAMITMVFTFGLFLNSSCAKEDSLNMKEKADGWIKVTVTYLDFEGGFYGLVSKQGDKLLPTNLKNEYRLPGTELKIKGVKVEGMVSTRQWGELFKITDVKLIKLGSNQATNQF